MSKRYPIGSMVELDISTGKLDRGQIRSVIIRKQRVIRRHEYLAEREEPSRRDSAYKGVLKVRNQEEERLGNEPVL
jgi:hypothetical protein